MKKISFVVAFVALSAICALAQSRTSQAQGFQVQEYVPLSVTMHDMHHPDNPPTLQGQTELLVRSLKSRGNVRIFSNINPSAPTWITRLSQFADQAYIPAQDVVFASVYSGTQSDALQLDTPCGYGWDVVFRIAVTESGSFTLHAAMARGIRVDLGTVTVNWDGTKFVANGGRFNSDLSKAMEWGRWSQGGARLAAGDLSAVPLVWDNEAGLWVSEWLWATLPADMMGEGLRSIGLHTTYVPNGGEFGFFFGSVFNMPPMGKAEPMLLDRKNRIYPR